MTYVLILVVAVMVWLIVTGKIRFVGGIPEHERPKPPGVVAGAFWEASREEPPEPVKELTLAEAYDERMAAQVSHDEILAGLPDHIRQALAPAEFKDTTPHAAGPLSAASVHDAIEAPRTMVATTIVDSAGNHIRTDWVPEGEPLPSAYLQSRNYYAEQMALSVGGILPAAGWVSEGEPKPEAVLARGHRGPPPSESARRYAAHPRRSYNYP